eukprot:3616516-Alexandrium_andersonii.AAC.1
MATTSNCGRTPTAEQLATHRVARAVVAPKDQHADEEGQLHDGVRGDAHRAKVSGQQGADHEERRRTPGAGRTVHHAEGGKQRVEDLRDVARVQ